MYSNSINCRCLRGLIMKNISLTVILLIFVSCEVQRAFSAPDYHSLHERLSLREKMNKENVKKIVKKSQPIIAETGRVFRYSLDKLLSKNKKNKLPKVHVSEAKEGRLPNWLSYNAHNNKLVGIPSKTDVRKLYLVIKSSALGVIEVNKIEIEVRESKRQSYCHDGNPSLVASAILNGDVNDFLGRDRVKIMRHFAEYIDIEMHELNMAERKSDRAFDPSIITAGPGGKLGSQKRKQGIVISWPVACGLGIPGDISINKLKLSSGTDMISKKVGLGFVGWYVFKQQYRVRRQAFLGATPVATPAASIPVPKSVTTIISGTPVISPTPSIVVKTTVPVVKSTTVVLTPTPAPPTQPPTTEAPTTKPVTTQKLTTEMKTTTEMKVETTEKPEVTTKKVTTKPMVTTEKMTTTMEPVTTEKTTMKPVKTTMKPVKTTMEPVETTMKPVETTMEPEITTMKPETKPPVITVKPTMKKDMKPELDNSIDLIELYPREAHKLKIKRDLFDDDIDGDTYNLTLSLKRVKVQLLTNADESWIYLDTVGKYLYILPEMQHIGDNHFAIQATDSSGNQQNAVFDVKVKDDNTVYSSFFNVSIDADFAMFTKNAKNKVELVDKIATATDVAYKTIRTFGFYEGSVVMNYACEALVSADPCNSVEAQAYQTKLTGSQFKDSMAPEYIVVGTSSSIANCGAADDPLKGKKAPNAQARNEYKWWEVVLIPVIVIAVLLLVIGLIFFFLYRRKRRYNPQKEDKNTFLYQKKPVIFREEFDDKPDLVSLQPLTLPNEKGPVTDSEYPPRTSTPDGHASSSNSTDGEEKHLIEKSSPPETPVSQGPPRSPPYGRSPPPYTES